MEYKGIFKIFNQNMVKDHLFEKDSKKVSFDDFLKPSDVDMKQYYVEDKVSKRIKKLQNIY